MYFCWVFDVFGGLVCFVWRVLSFEKCDFWRKNQGFEIFLLILYLVLFLFFGWCVVSFGLAGLWGDRSRFWFSEAKSGHTCR